MRSSRHGPYRRGYTCVTTAVTMGPQGATWRKSRKTAEVRIGGCNSPSVKAESLVIADQHAAVNGLGPCTHRPSRQGSAPGAKEISGM
jgi:hypothetical protein